MIKALTVFFMIVTFTGATLLAGPMGSKEVEDGIAKAKSLKKLKQYKEAIELLTGLMEKYPAEDYDIGKQLAILYGMNEEFEKGMAIWEAGHKKGYYYFIIPRAADYKAYLKQKKFKDIFRHDHVIRKKVNDKNSVKYEVVTPKNYTKKKKYPVFFILHGGGSTIARAQKNWTSNTLTDDFIVVFLQSYIHYEMSTYGWKSSDPKTREEIKRCYDEITAKYAVDTSKAIIGGISAGATMAIDIVLTDTIPVNGFITACPGKPKEFKDDTIKAAAEAGKKGIMVAGEKDFYRPKQDQMINAFDKLGFQYLYTVIPKMGHSYPENFSTWIDIAIQRMF
jgi:dienelactone hydrolase